MSFDINKIRKDFPILTQKVNNKDLIYLDNAATTQKPNIVIDTITEFYSKYNSNVHRGVHFLSNYTTEAAEQVRETVRAFINAESTEEIIFTSGTTDSVNLVAYSFGEAFINTGDEIIVSEMEHHSNIVPWQLLCKRKNAVIKVLPFNDDGDLELSNFEDLITNKTKLIAVTHISNSLGTVNPVKEIIKTARKHNVHILIDGAQAVHHTKVDVRDLDCDFYVFSGHKMYGPTGTGVLYGKKDLLNAMPPYKGGGEMIAKVSFDNTTFNVLPFKFEAGTPNYIDIIAFGKAIEYLNNIGIPNIKKHEDDLLIYASNTLKSFERINIIGNAKQKSGVISFIIDGMHFYDAGVLLDQMGIAIRTGTHCAETVMQHFNIDGTARISFAMYNTKKEIDKSAEALQRIFRML
jgi:cysteine desulfurase / selenocysteine lyase